MDKAYVLVKLQTLLSIASPTGFTQAAMDWLQAEVESLGYSVIPSRKGSFQVMVPGKTKGPARFLAAHVDTLGAMVRAIKPNGRLKIVPIGGLPLVAAEAENVLIHTRDQNTISGTIMPIKSSVHLYSDEVRKTERTSDTVEVRIDEQVDSAEDVSALGIAVGDYISLDPRTQVTTSGFIKSRFLDDKSCCAVLLALLQSLKNIQPEVDSYFMFSNYEEVGHGIYNLPDNIAEMISVDIGVVGETQTASEHQVTIFSKDGATPYDHGLNTQLVELCQANDIDYNVDVIDYYSSDASAAIRQGHDIRIACLGPGVEATHHYERTHTDSLVMTYRLLEQYLQSPLR